MCNAHYSRYKRHGDAQSHIPLREGFEVKLCSTGCGRTVLARGYCATHYQRWFTSGDAGEAGLRRTPGDPNATEKACVTCGQVKPIDDFYGDKRTRDKRQSDCKTCFSIKQAQHSVMRKYGLTPDQHSLMRSSQRDECEICRRKVKLVIDHCHKSGNVRSLLCDRCNLLIGHAGDDADLLEAAKQYIISHR